MRSMQIGRVVVFLDVFYGMELNEGFVQEALNNYRGQTGIDGILYVERAAHEIVYISPSGNVPILHRHTDPRPSLKVVGAEKGDEVRMDYCPKMLRLMIEVLGVVVSVPAECDIDKIDQEMKDLPDLSSDSPGKSTASSLLLLAFADLPFDSQEYPYGDLGGEG